MQVIKCMCNVWVKSHNSLFEADELFLLLLPALKVSIDQALQLNQILVLTLLLDVLQDQRQKHNRQPDRNTQQQTQILHVVTSTYIKVHFLTIGDLWSAGPAGESGFKCTGADCKVVLIIF